MDKGKSGFSTLLNDGQREVYDAILEGDNVCVTGGAGVGKTYVVKAAIDSMRRAGKKVLVTAPTGIAALNLGGVTIHRAFNVGFFDTKHIKPRVKQDVKRSLASVDAIVIDEVSMCRADLFDIVCAYVMDSWGDLFSNDLQLIVAGDFLQLPPVVTRDDVETLLIKYGENAKESFAFQSPKWEQIGMRCFDLKEVMRQRDDSRFADALNAARFGVKESLIWIYEHSSDDPFDDAITICSRNSDADSINMRKLRNIPGGCQTYIGSLIGEAKWGDTLMQPELTVKVGARVMGLVNSDVYKNGSLGTVISCDGLAVTVRWDSGAVSILGKYTQKVIDRDGEEIGSIRQVPLRLAFAITIHKSQGQTFDHVNIMPDCFAAGQLYVALSRCTHAGGIYFLKQPTISSLKVNMSALEFTRGCM